MTPTLQTFGPFALDAAHRRLTRDGVPVHLAAKPFDTLALLVANHGRPVTRDQLRTHVWQSVVSDNTIENTVTQVRKALGDDPVHPVYIQTLYGIGYEFIADVQTLVPAPQEVLPIAPTAPVSFVRHALQAVFASALYAALYSIAVFVEIAYAVEEYIRQALGYSAFAFVWMFTTTLGGLFAGWRRSTAGKDGGLLISATTAATAVVLLLFSASRFLPGSVVTPLSFQGHTALSAFVKNAGYFFALGISFIVLPFQYVVGLHLKQRPFSSQPPAVFARPWFLLLILITAWLWSHLSVSRIIEHLLPGKHMGLYINLLQGMRLLAFALGFECLAWYSLTLKRLARVTPSAEPPTPLPRQ